jgi:tyrosyl-tRNA synthetase
MNDKSVVDFGYVVKESDITDGYIMLKKGKKSFCKVEVK